MQTTARTRRLVESGLMIALSIILSMLKIFKMPWGGSVTFCSMLPMILLSYRWGVKWGAFSALIYAIMQAIFGAIDGTFTMVALGAESGIYSSGILEIPYWLAVVGIIFLDYIAAFTVLGLGGAFKKMNKNTSLLKGTLLATASRYAVHTISGYIFFGTFASWFFGEIGRFGEVMLENFDGKLLFLLYSVIYNGCFMVPEIVITALCAYWLEKSGRIK